MSVEQDFNFPGERVAAGFDVGPVATPQPEAPFAFSGAVSAETVKANPEAPKAQPALSETERLDPQPTPMVLVSGTEFDLEPLKLRQFLRLLRIVTRGAADVLDSAEIDFENPDAFVQQFLGMVLFSIPEAEEETVEFIKSMVRPRVMTGNPDKDLIAVRELLTEVDNPELEDTITIVQVIIEREGEDLRKLGKRLGSMFKVAQKMGATSGLPAPTSN